MASSVKAHIERTLPATVRECHEADGTLLPLPFPYTVPCAGEQFQELYYWDTYFTNLGLLTNGQETLAKHNVDNMLYLVDTYGFMPNGNRTYYLNRSQPPFLSHMVRDVYASCKDRAWLDKAYASLCREYEFWQTHRVVGHGLNGYTGYAVQRDEAAFLYDHFVLRTGQRLADTPDAAVKHEAAMATFSFFESGWDCNSRFLTQGHRIMAVDLNSLLYAMERHMAYFSQILENGDETVWQARAATRRERMVRTLWDEDRGVFVDRHADTMAFSSYLSAASLYPLFVGVADEQQAQAYMALFERLCTPHGVAAGEPHPPWGCQWDYPNVWAPLQWIAYGALKRYGYDTQAAQVAERFVRLVEREFERTGNLWEKYNGVTGKVAAEEYAAPPMMGWTAGVYLALKEEQHASSQLSL